MKLHAKEIENVSKLKPYKRYEYFIRKIADFEELWTLVDNNEDLALSHVDEKIMISFWSTEDFITSNLDDNWKGFKPLKITLDNFEEKIIPVIEENDYLINVFPVNGRSGFVVSLNEFIRDLNEVLEQYR